MLLYTAQHLCVQSPLEYLSLREGHVISHVICHVISVCVCLYSIQKLTRYWDTLVCNNLSPYMYLYILYGEIDTLLISSATKLKMNSSDGSKD